MLKQEFSNPPICVGITSIPGRELSLIETLDSVFSNSVSPSRVSVTLFRNYKNYGRYNLSLISSYATTHDVEVIMLDEDLGPCAKLLGLLPHIQAFDCNYVLLLDDDHIYRDYLIETCQTEAQANHDFCGSFYVYQVGELDIGQGADGLIINVGLLRNFREYYDYLIQTNSMWFYNDDFIISSFLFNKGVKIYDMRHLLHPNDRYIYSFGSGHEIHGLNRMTGIYERRRLNKILLQSFRELYPEKLLMFR